jgi:hypothetical protein
MRDDNTVSTFRLRTFWFKILIVLALSLFGTCAAGIYGLLHFQDKYNAVSKKLDVLQAELNETRVKLQDRTNLAILPYGDPSPDKFASSESYALNNVVQPFRANAETASASNNYPTQNNRSAQPDGKTSTSVGASSQGADRSENTASPGQTVSSASADSTETTKSSDADATLTLEDMQKLMGQNGPVTVAGINSIFKGHDNAEDYPLQISNVSTSIEAGNKLRLNFDITNLPQKATLAGNCSVFAITRQGAEIEIPPVIRGALSFRIGRFRKMQAVLSLPDSVSASDFTELRFNLIVAGLPAYWKSFPFSL